MNYFKRHNKLTAAIVAIIVIGLSAGATVLLLNSTKKADSPAEVSSHNQEVKKEADANLKKASDYEQNGETQNAIDSYKKANSGYAEIGDDEGIQGTKIQIDYLEKVLSGKPIEVINGAGDKTGTIDKTDPNDTAPNFGGAEGQEKTLK